MGRYPSQSIQTNNSLAQLLALNVFFDAVRGENEGAALLALQTAQKLDAIAPLARLDPACDVILTQCYAALMEGSGRPPRLS